MQANDDEQLGPYKFGERKTLIVLSQHTHTLDRRPSRLLRPRACVHSPLLSVAAVAAAAAAAAAAVLPVRDMRVYTFTRTCTRL